MAETAEHVNRRPAVDFGDIDFPGRRKPDLVVVVTLHPEGRPDPLSTRQLYARLEEPVSLAEGADHPDRGVPAGSVLALVTATTLGSRQDQVSVADTRVALVVILQLVQRGLTTDVASQKMPPVESRSGVELVVPGKHAMECRQYRSRFRWRFRCRRRRMWRRRGRGGVSWRRRPSRVAGACGVGRAARLAGSGDQESCQSNQHRADDYAHP